MGFPSENPIPETPNFVSTSFPVTGDFGEVLGFVVHRIQSEMAASVALRSSCLRAISRISTGSAARNVSVSSVLPSVRSSFVSRRISISPHSLRLLLASLDSSSCFDVTFCFLLISF